MGPHLQLPAEPGPAADSPGQQEEYRLSLDVGYGAAWHLMNLAAVEATWGRDQDARKHAEEALALPGQQSFWSAAPATRRDHSAESTPNGQVIAV